MATTTRTRTLLELPTLALLAGAYLVWAASVTVLAGIAMPVAIIACAIAITLHSSLQHETVHGTTLINQNISEWLVALPIGLLVPYRRFRDTHLEHHRDARLTDPYDDPESNFLDPGDWEKLHAPGRAILKVNGTLLGRMMIGPFVSQITFMSADVRAIRCGDRGVAIAWALHLAGVALVLALVVWLGSMPLWAYGLSAWLGMSVLKIRTYLEHRAHERAGARSVVIEDRGPLALLFLNNNFHAVHHCHPGLAWYRIPARYRDAKEDFLRRNDGYVYRSYGEVFGRYLVRRKDPVAHPLWRR